VNDAATPATDPSTPVVMPVTAGSGTAFRGARLRRAWLIAGVALVLAVLGVGLAWRADQRVRNVEQELVRRQQESAGQASKRACSRSRRRTVLATRPRRWHCSKRASPRVPCSEASSRS
jgi:hypothetical protein